MTKVRIGPAELQAVQRAGMLTRFAVLGPVIFVMADLPESGTAGTGLDIECLREHHGLVMRGSFTVHHADGRTETFEQGDAFYVPPGPPTHTFTSSGQCIVEGFGRLPTGTDTSMTALDALGFSAADVDTPLVPPPATIRLRGSVAPFRKTGAIDIEGSRMGDWMFVRARFGPRGGYTSGWCDQTHWGVVLDGEMAITYAGEMELATRGDVYLATPGHRFTSPDGATIADYTDRVEVGVARVPAWRRAALQMGAKALPVPAPEPTPRPTEPSDAEPTSRVVRVRMSLAPA
jgi:mannose-6-phosphate isomerase-like protein (cupin superfamily)